MKPHGFPMDCFLETQKIFKRSLLLIGVSLYLGLQGCATYTSYDGWIGSDKQFVLDRMGPPSGEYALGENLRLVYWAGPYGLKTYFFEFDKRGRLISWIQTLSERNFQKIVPGMVMLQVELLLGPPSNRAELARGRGNVWSYRFETPFCVWFQIEFDSRGVVRSAGRGIPPECLGGEFAD